MGVIAKYKFNSSLCADFIPKFNSGFTGYTTSDVTNEDNTITRTISHDTLKPTLIRFGQRDGTSYANLGSTALLEIIELDTSSITDMYDMFRGCTNLTSITCNWQTSNVTNMRYIFENCSSLTSLDLSNFDTSKVTNMNGMFGGCSSLTSLDVSNFDTSKVTNMYSMFQNCFSLTSLNISNFDTRNLIYMSSIFSTCNKLTSLDLSNFDTSNVTDMRYIFENCSSLTSLDLSNFDTSKVNNMKNMFQNCNKLTSLDLSNFDTSNVTDMCYMFYNCNKLTSLDLSNFNTSKVTNMNNMFNKCSSLTKLNVSNFNTSSVTSMYSIFDNCKSLLSLDLSNFDTSKVTNMYGMFGACSSLTSLDLSNFDTSKVTSMSYMFYGCSSLTSLDLSNFNTSKVTDMQGMIAKCSSLTSLDLSRFDTSNVTDMGHMFDASSSLTSLDLSSFNTSNVTNMDSMFNNCSSLTSLDISNFNTRNVTSMTNMFNNCLSFNIGLLYASSSTINSLLTPLGTSTARNIYYLDADPSELTAQDNINYVEYKESAVEIPSEIVLRSLPNGIKDTLSLKTGRYVKRIGEAVINNNNSSWIVNMSDLTTKRIRVSNQALLGADAPGPNLYCDKLPVNRDIGYISDKISLSGLYQEILYLYVPRDIVGVSESETDQNILLNSVVTWLAQFGDIKVTYPLATPVETYIDLQKLPLSYTNGKLQLSAQSILPTLKYSVQTNKYEVPELLANTNYTIKSNEEQFIFDNYIQRGYISNEITETDSSSTKVTLNATTVNSDGETVTDTSVRVEDEEPEVLRIEGQTYQNLITESSETDYAVLDLDADIDAQYATINNTVQGNIHGAKLVGQTIFRLNYDTDPVDSVDNDDVVCSYDSTTKIYTYGRKEGSTTSIYPCNLTRIRCRLRIPTPSQVYTLILTQLTGGKTKFGVQVGYNNGESNYNTYDAKEETLKHGIHKIVFTMPSNVVQLTHFFVRLVESETQDNITFKDILLLEGDYSQQDIDYRIEEGMQSVQNPVVTTVENLFDVKKIISNSAFTYSYSTNIGRFEFTNRGDVTTYTNIQLPAGTYDISFLVRGVCDSGMVAITFRKDGEVWYNCSRVEIDYYKLNSNTFKEVKSQRTFDAPVTVTLVGHGWAGGATGSGWCEIKNIRFTPVGGKSSILSCNDDVVLRKVGGVQDELDLETGKLTQRFNEIVIDETVKGTIAIHQPNNSELLTFRLESVANDGIIDVQSMSDKLLWNNTSGMINYPYSFRLAPYGNPAVIQLFICLPKSVLSEESRNGLIEWLSNNHVKIQYPLALPIIKTVDLSIVDRDNNTLPTIQTFPTVTHISTSSQCLIPNVLIPQLKYPTLIKPSTQYTVQLKSTTFNSENPLTINLGGTSMTVPSTKFTITTPNTLTSQDVIFTGGNNVIGEVVVIEGNLVNNPFPFFEGFKSSFEGESSIEIKTTGKNLFNIRGPINEKYDNMNTPQLNYIEGNTIYAVEAAAEVHGSGQKIKCKPNTRYSITFERTGGAQLGIHLPNRINEVATKASSFIYQTPKDCYEFLITVYYYFDNNMIQRPGTIQNLQIEEIISSPYEPYKSTTTTLNITEPLRSLPNGVRDKVIFKDGVAKLVRRIGKVVLDGSEEWVGYTVHNNNVRIQITLANCVYKNSVTSQAYSVCDKLPSIPWNNSWTMNYNLITINECIIYFQLADTSLTKQQMLDWLNQNPITIYYELANPITEILSPDNLPYLYKDGHIFTNTDYPAKLVYKPKTARYMLKTTAQDSTTKTFYADDPNILLLEGNKLAYKIPTFQGLCSVDFKGVNNCALSSPVILRRLPDGTCDTFNALTGVITRNIVEIEMNGTIKYRIAGESGKSPINGKTYWVNNIANLNSTGSSSLNLISDKAINVNKWDTENTGEISGLSVALGGDINKTLRFSIPNTMFNVISNTDEFNQWLMENPIKILGPALTPTYTSISDILKPQASPNGTIYLDTTDQSINPVFKYRMPTTNFYQLNMDSNSVYTVQSKGAYTLNGVTTNVSGSTTINSNSTIIDL